MHKNVKLMKKAFSNFYNVWIFPNFPQNVDKIPNSKGPGPRTKNGCDDLVFSALCTYTCTFVVYYMYIL